MPHHLPPQQLQPPIPPPAQLPIQPQIQAAAPAVSPPPLPPPPAPTRSVDDHPRLSPISVNKEDTDTIQRLFIWKLERIYNAVTREKLKQFRDIILEQQWNLDDLRAMKNKNSRKFRRALELGAANGFVSNIASWLRKFKAYYRQQKAAMAANALTDLAGGFMGR